MRENVCVCVCVCVCECVCVCVYVCVCVCVYTHQLLVVGEYVLLLMASFFVPTASRSSVGRGAENPARDQDSFCGADC